MYGKVCYTQSIIIDLTHLISFELRRVIDENERLDSYRFPSIYIKVTKYFVTYLL